MSTNQFFFAIYSLFALIIIFYILYFRSSIKKLNKRASVIKQLAYELKLTFNKYSLSISILRLLAGGNLLNFNVMTGIIKGKNIKTYDFYYGYFFPNVIGAIGAIDSTYIYIDNKQIFPSPTEKRKILNVQEITDILMKNT